MRQTKISSALAGVLEQFGHGRPLPRRLRPGHLVDEDVVLGHLGVDERRDLHRRLLALS
jgi:hypothetical protein